MKIVTPPGVLDIANLFFENGEEVRCIGGSVRDSVMGKQPKDWDMATPAAPERTMKLLESLGRPYDLSNGHGTVSIVLDGETYEITTLRVDAETDGRHAKVQFVTDWELDSARRDFTFNAMSMDPLTGRLFDYFRGEDDIQDKKIRFVGVTVDRIREDYLRILRFFRFAGRFGFQIDFNDIQAITLNMRGLDKVSGERIWMEVRQILELDSATAVVNTMKMCGVWNQIVNRKAL
jgi:tRNA nucleotidyltransferase (CCA-adding enzyme)